MRRALRSSGFTLVELLITGAISSLIVTAAVSVFIATTTKQRHSELVIEATNAAALGSSVMEFELSSVGYRWPSAAYGFRHVNNVTSSVSLSSVGSTLISTTGNCDGTGVGLVPGSDVVEVAQGYEFMSPGKVLSITNGVGTTTPTVVLSSSLPFTSLETTGSGVGSVLLFVGENGASCVGRVETISGVSTDGGADAPTTMQMRLLDRTYANAANAAYAPNCPSTGGTTPMRVFRLGSRTRFMVCGSTGAGASPNASGLYRQSAGINGKWTAPVRVQDGIEDLQVAPRYLNTGGVMAATGTGTNCITLGTASSSLCTCNDSTPATCKLPAGQEEPTLAAVNTNRTLTMSMIALVRGASIELSAVSNRPRGRTPDSLRAASFDHTVSTTPDDFDRRRQRFGVTFDNLGLIP